MVMHPAACMARSASSRTQIRGFFFSVSCSLSAITQSNNRSEECQFESRVSALRLPTAFASIQCAEVNLNAYPEAPPFKIEGEEPKLQVQRPGHPPQIRTLSEGSAAHPLLDLTTSNRGQFLGDSTLEHRRGSWTDVCALKHGYELLPSCF